MSFIDANTGLTNDQQFTFLGDLALNQIVKQAGTLWVSESAGDTMLYGNTDGDSAREFEVRIDDGATLASMYSGNDFVPVMALLP